MFLARKVPQRAFVRPFHGRDFCDSRHSRRPLLSYIRATVCTLDLARRWPITRRSMLSENDTPLNQAALEWLREAKADGDRYYLYLLQLASWGLDDGLAGDWPSEHRYALRGVVAVVDECVDGHARSTAERWRVRGARGAIGFHEDAGVDQPFRTLAPGTFRRLRSPEWTLSAPSRRGPVPAGAGRRLRRQAPASTWISSGRLVVRTARLVAAGAPVSPGLS